MCEREKGIEEWPCGGGANGDLGRDVLFPFLETEGGECLQAKFIFLFSLLRST